MLIPFPHASATETADDVIYANWNKKTKFLIATVKKYDDCSYDLAPGKGCDEIDLNLSGRVIAFNGMNHTCTNLYLPKEISNIERAVLFNFILKESFQVVDISNLKKEMGYKEICQKGTPTKNKSSNVYQCKFQKAGKFLGKYEKGQPTEDFKGLVPPGETVPVFIVPQYIGHQSSLRLTLRLAQDCEVWKGGLRPFLQKQSDFAEKFATDLNNWGTEKYRETKGTNGSDFQMAELAFTYATQYNLSFLVAYTNLASVQLLGGKKKAAFRTLDTVFRKDPQFVIKKLRTDSDFIKAKDDPAFSKYFGR